MFAPKAHAPRAPQMATPVVACCWALLTVLSANIACAEDTVVYRSTNAPGKTTQKTGEVIDFNGLELRLLQTNGRETAIATERILRVKTPKTRAHLQGNQLYAAHQFQEALRHYAQAIREEQRTWVRRQILVQQIWCARNLGQIEVAGDQFTLVLLKSDPQTQYFDAIPLAWSPQAVSGAREQRVQKWLAADQPASKLLGASWLLSTNQQATAVATLRQLATAKDKRIALLAEAQTWRTQVITARETDVARWQQVIAATPAELQGGPLYVLAKAQQRLGRSDQAALSYLRLPILFPNNRPLAASALLAAGDTLAPSHPADARQMYQELVRDYAETSQAANAKQQLAKLKDESKE
ncbi:MAG: hypothetical protein CL681_19765 [Blastopirellula sp.]|nr:hypothetical protein [Blastopirellula sp.]